MPTKQPITLMTFICSQCEENRQELRRRSIKNKICSECRQSNREKYRKDNLEQRLSYSKRYRQDNPEKSKNACSDWYKRNKQQRKEYRRAHYLANLDAYRKQRKEYYRSNSDKAKEDARRWVEENRDRVKQRDRIYHQNNKDKARAAGERRRGRYVGTFRESDIATIRENQKNKCAGPLCCKSLNNGYHIDHITPVAKGGTNWPHNLQLLCPKCNLKKGSKDPYVWAQENGRLFI